MDRPPLRDPLEGRIEAAGDAVRGAAEGTAAKVGEAKEAIGAVGTAVGRRLPPGGRRRLLSLRARFRGRPGLIAFLAVMGPGFIAGVAGNDAGGITTYSVMGAQTGFGLLWVFPLTIVILAVVQEMAARLGVVTGQGLSDLIRDRYGVRWTALAMAVLLIANVANTVAEFAGAAAALSIFGVPVVVTVPVLAVAIWALVLFASYRTVERVFLSIALVFLAYVAAAILARPDWGHVANALVSPSLAVSGAVVLLLVQVVGTTITPYMMFYLQSAVAEKGIDEEELGLEQADAVVGSIWTNVIALFIVVACAQALFLNGQTQIGTAADAARALGPFAGSFSTVLFAVGLFGASALAATIMPISTAFVVCEAFGLESGVGKRFGDARVFFGLYTLILAIGAVVVLVAGQNPIGLILSSQFLQGLLLPIVLIFMLLLVNDRRLLGRHTNGRWRNLVATICVGLVGILSLAGLGAQVLGLGG